MNVTELKLLPQEYMRANYFKTEVMHAVRYIKQVPAKAALIRQFLTDAANLAGAAVIPTPPATTALVTNGQAIVIGPSTYTFTVAGGVVTNIVVS